MENTVYLALVNIVLWLLIFVMMYKTAANQRTLQKEIAGLEQLNQDTTE